MILSHKLPDIRNQNMFGIGVHSGVDTGTAWCSLVASSNPDEVQILDIAETQVSYKPT